MNQKVPNIAKNTSYFTLALVLQKIISFIYFVILARDLGPSEMGQYYFAISFTTIFAIFIDLGLTSVLTREIAKDKSKASELLSSVVAVKIPLSIFVFAAAAVLINLTQSSVLTRQLVYLSCIPMILDSFALTFFSVSRGFHNLKFESIAAVAFQGIMMICGLIFLKIGLGLKWLMLAIIIASSFNFVYALIIVKKKWFISIFLKPNMAVIKLLLAIAAPFAVFGILQRLYTYFDTVLLAYLAGDYYVGIYQVPFKIIFALQFLPMAFVASLYPAFASYWKGNKEQLAITFERAMNYLIIISVPISIGIIVLANRIILLFTADYEAAVLPLQIIMCSLLLNFINFPIGSLLNACDKQKANTVNMAATLACSVILNLILIPRYQAVGAAMTVVISTALMFILGMIQTPKIIRLRPKKIIIPFLKSLIAGLLMAILILLVKNYLNIFINVILGAICYFIFLFMVKGFTKEDISSVFKTFKKNN